MTLSEAEVRCGRKDGESCRGLQIEATRVQAYQSGRSSWRGSRLASTKELAS